MAAEAIACDGRFSTVQGDLYYAILTRQDTSAPADTDLQTASSRADKDRDGSVDAKAEQQAGPLSSEVEEPASTSKEILWGTEIEGGVGTDAGSQVAAAISSISGGDAEKKSSVLTPRVPGEAVESAGALQSGGGGLCDARQVDGLLPQAVDPMCCLPLCRDLGTEDPAARV